MVEQLRFLVLCSYFPWHGHGGGLLVGNMIRQLTRHHRVTVLSYSSPEEIQYKSELQLPSTDIHWVTVPDHIPTPNQHADELASGKPLLGLMRNTWRKFPQPIRSGVNRARWFLHQIRQYRHSPYPVEIGRFQTVAFQDKLENLLRNQAFDIVLSEWPEMGCYGLLGGCEMLRVLDTIEMRSLTYARAVKQQANLDGRFGIWLDWRKMRSFEKRMCREYDIVTAVSTREASLYEKYRGKAAILHNPIGLELDRYTFVGQEQRNPYQIIFLGRMSYGPNQDAVNYFLNNIYPQIRRRLPEVQLWIVGGAPSQDLLKYSGTDGIHVTGYVPDVTHYLNTSSVFVLPMRQGAGIKIKALEAMAIGVPVVSTPQGMEGIDIAGECLISETDQDFAQNVIRLCKDMNIRQSMAENARRLIVDRYDCQKNVTHLVEIYQRSLAEKRRAIH